MKVRRFEFYMDYQLNHQNTNILLALAFECCILSTFKNLSALSVATYCSPDKTWRWSECSWPFTNANDIIGNNFRRQVSWPIWYDLYAGALKNWAVRIKLWRDAWGGTVSSLRSFFTNMSVEMPFHKKLYLVLRNWAIKIVEGQNCCGRPGEPGCCEWAIQSSR